MIAVRDKYVIQIEVTNVCENECSNCSRFVGHYRNTYFMKLEEVEKAIDSLRDFPGGIGIMGGEPLMHPDFADICGLMKRMVSPGRRFLWTSGTNWNMYREVIRDTFGNNVNFNNHKDTTQKHHPMLLSISDMIDDQELIKKLLDNCWVNRRWTASINPKGAFFCEIAAAMDVLFDGPGGHPVVQKWWDMNPEDFKDQIERYCYRCGACVPHLPVTLEELDVVSVSNYQCLEKVDSPKLSKNGIRMHKEKLSQHQVEELALQWQPWVHLGVMSKEGTGEKVRGMFETLYDYCLKVIWILRRAKLAVSKWLWSFQKELTTKTKQFVVDTYRTHKLGR